MRSRVYHSLTVRFLPLLAVDKILKVRHLRERTTRYELLDCGLDNLHTHSSLLGSQGPGPLLTDNAMI